MKNSKAIVTLAIGEKYLKSWKRFCEANWQKYADKHGYDVICIDTPLDDSERAKGRSAAWQKCLILSQDFSQNYERIVWVDSDILINWAIAPCIIQDVEVDKVGAVLSWCAPNKQLSSEGRGRMFDFWGISDEKTGRATYVKYGIRADFEEIVQTGVLVLSPHHHREVLEKAYFEYEETGHGGEMPALSYEIIKGDYVQWIDLRFNMTWTMQKALYYPFLLQTAQPNIQYRVRRKLQSIMPGLFENNLARLCATTAYINSFFLHFAGAASEMRLVDLEATSWRDLQS